MTNEEIIKNLQAENKKLWDDYFKLIKQNATLLDILNSENFSTLHQKNKEINAMKEEEQKCLNEIITSSREVQAMKEGVMLSYDILKTCINGINKNIKDGVIHD